MKQPISDIFDKFSADEWDMLLGETLQPEPLDEVTKARIGATVLAQIPKAKRQRPRLRRILILAACLILLLTLGFGAYAEVSEYNAAVRFFDEYDLSTDGLSRGEIKAVFRDITTGSFSYSKTAEVLRRSLSTDQVPGYEISQEDPTPEEIEDLWYFKSEESWRGRYETWREQADSEAKKGIYYSYRSEYKMDHQLGFDVHDKSYFEKYEKDTLLWSVSFSEFWINDYELVTDGVIVYGKTPTYSGDQEKCSWLAKISRDGEVLWKQKVKDGPDNETIGAVVENSDGSYAVMSYAAFHRTDQSYAYFCLRQYTAKGKLKHFYKTEVKNYGIQNAVRFDREYLVQLGTPTSDEHDRIVKVDRKGHITDAFSYTDSESDYFITDMIEWGGKIYLSAYAVPKLPEHNDAGGPAYETHWIYKAIEAHWKEQIAQYGYVQNMITSEELTPVVRDNYTAMLLVCDPKSGTPQAFYSTKGSLGGKLTASEAGTLLWDVESVTTTFHSPMTSSFTIGGTCDVYRYTFNQKGTLLSQEKTGETTQYAR